LGDIMQFATGMAPAIGKCHILSRTFEQAVIARITIDLQGAAEVFQNSVRMLAGSSRRIGEGDAGGILAAPRPVIAGQGPEATCFGLLLPWRQNRRRCFIHEEFGGALQMDQKRFINRGQFER